MSNSISDYKALWEKKIGNKYNLEGVGDNSLGQGFNFWMYKERKDRFVAQVKKLRIPFKDAEIVEVGPGTGFYIDIWKNLGVSKIAGIDITDFSVGYLKSKYPASEFYQQDMGEELKVLKDRKFDVVTAIDVLFHIVDDDRFLQALKNINSLLKDNGVFIMSDNLPEFERRHHIHTVRSKETVFKLLDEAGLVPQKVIPYTIFLNEPLNGKRLNTFIWELQCKILFRYKSKKYKNFAGYCVGGLFYLIDKFAFRFMEPPSNQLLICVKK